MKTMQDQNRILHLVDSSGFYGAERVILNLSKEMNNFSFSAVVGMICRDEKKIPIIGVAAKELGIETANFLSQFSFDPFCFFRIYKYLKYNSIKVVHSHGYKPSILAYIPCKLLNIPLVITCHLWFNDSDKKLQVYHMFEKMIMKRIPASVGVSREICEEIINNGVERARVRLIYNGIDLSNYRQYPMSHTKAAFLSLGLDEGDFVIGSIGRLHAQKAFHYLLAAIKLLLVKGINVKCVIFGEGPLREELENRCQEMRLQETVKFPGFREDIINILELMDVFVISSIDEGLPMVLLEAMAKRKAIISTPVGAINSVLTHKKNALLYSVGDVEELAEYINFMKNNPEKRKKFGEAAYQKFQSNFSSEIMAKKYANLYSSLQ